MLTDIDLEQLFILLSLPEKGRQLVRQARQESPVRDANSQLENSIIEQYSEKMGGRYLKLESRTVESPAATLYEDDDECLEYWPQPCRENLTIQDENGKTTSRTVHYPDFLVIRRDGIWLDDWREESRLMRLAAKGSQFHKDEEGWHFRSAEAHFGEMGLHHKARSKLELPRVFIENVRFLEDYMRPDCPPLSEDIEIRLVDIFSKAGSIPFLELLHDHDFDADDIFKAVIMKRVYVDLYNDLLHAPLNLVIHRDKAIGKAYRIIKEDRTPALPMPGMGRLSPGSRLKFDGKEFEVILVGGGNVLFKDNDDHKMSLPLDDVIALFLENDIDIEGNQNIDGSPIKSLADFSHQQLETAQKRLELITTGDTGEVAERSLQRWKANIDDTMSAIDKLIALTDRNNDKGNRTPRLPEKVDTLAEETIRKKYNTPTCRTIVATYHAYKDLCEEHDVEPMSYTTFTKRVKSQESTRDREGKRKDYQTSPIPLHLDYVFPIHGARPHEVCYIDHTILNLATIGPEGSELGKPTYSIATDGHTTQARALYVSYDPPSAKVVLMVLRDYVRRHNRLPKILVVDGGADFRSKYLKEFCRMYKISLRHRPGGRPRGGSPVERTIGATEEEVIAAMEGNTRIMKNARMVTKSVNPFQRAEWTLTAAHGALEQYLFEIRDTRKHPTLGITPREYEAMRMMETGQREHVIVKFDQNIMLMTCPHTSRKHHKIDPIRGVWADNRHYWHDDFKSARKTDSVEVRPEPWCANVAYVYYKNRWIAAIVRDLRPLSGRTGREAQVAIRAERRRAKVEARKDKLSKASSKKMLVLWKPENFDERLAKQQREMEHLYSRMGMTMAMNLDPSLISSDTHDQALDSSLLKTESDSTKETRVSEKTKNLPKKESTDSNFWGEIDGYI